MKTRRGTENDNIIDGSGVAEKIFGLGGNDTITGGGGNDKIWCGDNGLLSPGQWDNVDGGSGNDVIYGENGNDYLNGGAGTDKLFGGADDDFLFGNGGKDQISGDDGNDIISGDKGADILIGGDGNDRLMAISGNDTMDGGKGNDIYFTGMNKAYTTDKSGADEYHIEYGDASPVIADKTGIDILVFESFSKDQLVFSRDGYDLHIEIDGFQGETTISSFFLGKNNKIETLLDNTRSTDNPDGFDLSVLNALKYSGDSVDGADLWLA